MNNRKKELRDMLYKYSPLKYDLVEPSIHPAVIQPELVSTELRKSYNMESLENARKTVDGLYSICKTYNYERYCLFKNSLENIMQRSIEYLNKEI